ncbi:unnamed protein product [Boreogadus saida]
MLNPVRSRKERIVSLNDPSGGLGQSGSASQNNHNKALPQTGLAAVSPLFTFLHLRRIGSPIEIRSDPVCSHPSKEGSGIRERIGQAGEGMVWKAKKATNWP